MGFFINFISKSMRMPMNNNISFCTFFSEIHLRIPNEPLRIKGIFDIRNFISEPYLFLFRREIMNSQLNTLKKTIFFFYF